MIGAIDVTKALRGRWCNGQGLCRCPLPSHGRRRGDHNPSLSVTDGDKGILVHCFAGCDPRAILDELRRRGLIEDDPGRARRRTGTTGLPTHRAPSVIPDQVPDPEALSTWRGAVGDVAVLRQYFRSRGIVSDSLPPSLRAGTYKHLDRYQLPALIAAVQAPNRQIVAVQVTLIDPRGDRKAQLRIPRKTIGALGAGAVRLAAATDELGLAEGAEKGLAAQQIFGVPTWVTLGAGRMHRVFIPDTVRTLHIFADGDAPGREAAERTAQANRIRRVVIHTPLNGLKDWDDVLIHQRRCAA
jgi:hypothetical protein